MRGRDINLESYADVRGRGSLAREYTVTYRPTLAENEEVTLGRFWPEQAPAETVTEQEVSIEQSIHERFGIVVGDWMRFDVAGRPFEARVSSVRRVRWEDARSGGFMFVFRPGALAKAPHTFVGFVRGPAEADARARLQFELVSRYPNISAIDARDVIARIQSVVDNIVLAISIVGGIALASGVLILVGAVAMTKFQRVYEAAILRTLGASTRMLTTVVALEYSALGLLAGLIGALGSLALSWAVTKFLLDIAWKPAPFLLLGRRCRDVRSRGCRRRAGQCRSAAPETSRSASRRISADLASQSRDADRADHHRDADLADSHGTGSRGST